MRTLEKISHTLILLLMTVFARGQDFDLQGHRGARGLYPENSIPAFHKALELGVTTLELDVVISDDRKVVISHDPWINPQFCIDPEGNEIPEEKGRDLNIFKMNYEEVKSYDCGTKGNKAYPQQKKISVCKPLLSEMISDCESYIKDRTGYPVRYNIEIKSSESGDNIYHPEPAEFSKIVYDVIASLISFDRVNIQSFDLRILQYWHGNYPHVILSYLTENNRSAKENIEVLGFKPDIYSPEYWRMKNEDIEYVHSQGIKLIPWTVNKKEDMAALREKGVDGLITDYPDLAASLGMTLKIPYQEDKE